MFVVIKHQKNSVFPLLFNCHFLLWNRPLILKTGTRIIEILCAHELHGCFVCVSFWPFADMPQERRHQTGSWQPHFVSNLKVRRYRLLIHATLIHFLEPPVLQSLLLATVKAAPLRWIQQNTKYPIQMGQKRNTAKNWDGMVGSPTIVYVDPLN